MAWTVPHGQGLLEQQPTQRGPRLVLPRALGTDLMRGRKPAHLFKGGLSPDWRVQGDKAEIEPLRSVPAERSVYWNLQTMEPLSFARLVRGSVFRLDEPQLTDHLHLVRASSLRLDRVAPQEPTNSMSSDSSRKDHAALCVCRVTRA
jgi:hypothetical protein